MPETAFNNLLRPLAKRLQANHMAVLGIANTMRLAHAYNRARFRRQNVSRCSLYHQRFGELLDDNGPPTRPAIEMRDGWAIDNSMSLPHLDRVLEDSEKIIAERAGERRSSKGAYRSYFQDLWTPADLEKYPSFLDFVTSSDVLATVANYLQSVPALSTTLPWGSAS